MKKLLYIFLALIIISAVIEQCGKAMDWAKHSVSSGSSSSNSNSNLTDNTSVTAVDIDNANACMNFLKGKSFYGGNVRVEFQYDGNVGVYNSQTNELVFTGYAECGERYGNASRRVKITATTGSQVLKLMLGEDGKLMDESDFTIYKTNL